MERVIELPSAATILGSIENEEHRKDASICGPCSLDVSRTALTELVYFFGECECEQVPYLHLTERVWHRSCFAEEFSQEGKG